MTMLVAQPQGEIPVESAEIETESMEFDQNNSGISSSAQMTDNNSDDHMMQIILKLNNQLSIW